ncbi:MAG: hypothetical protein NZ455_15015 [Bacteroidia bacterium]|nr:hypothetical protein [Bacteroidia bacterium]MDW8346005.1 hypothetical protein [Bacteroidia bacterium]
MNKVKLLLILLISIVYIHSIAQKDSILYSNRVRMGLDFGVGYSWLNNQSYEKLTITGRSINAQYWLQVPLIREQQKLLLRFAGNLTNQYYNDFTIKRDTLPATNVIGSSFTIFSPMVCISYYPFDDYWGKNPLSIHAAVGLYTILSYHNQIFFTRPPNFYLFDNYNLHLTFMRGWQDKTQRNYVSIFLRMDAKYYNVAFPRKEVKDWAYNVVAGISYYSKPPIKRKKKK